MKYEKCEWVVIIKNKDNEYFNQFIGLAYPVINKEDDRITLPIPTKRDAMDKKYNAKGSYWVVSETRRATPKEKEVGMLRLCAEEL